MASTTGEEGEERQPLPQLSIEIWHNVFTYLNVPANTTTIYSRPDAKDLTRCMRVCSSWFLAAGKALYAPVVFTKTVPGLLLGFDVPIKPVASGSSGTTIIKSSNGNLGGTFYGEIENDSHDARRLMAGGNFKRPLLRYVTRIVIISCDIEAPRDIPELRPRIIRRCTEDWDYARSILSHPLLPACLPNLLGVRNGNTDYEHHFRRFWERNTWARYEPKDRGRQMLLALGPRYWCDSQSGFLYSLPCPTRVTDYESGKLPRVYTYHAHTAEHFRILWGTGNKVIYHQDDECNGPRDEGAKWATARHMAADVYGRLVALFPPWVPHYTPDPDRDETLPKIIRDTTFSIQGIVQNWHWDVELLMDEEKHEAPVVPANAAEWAAVAEKAKEKERQTCREIETILRTMLRRQYGGTERLWEEKVKVYDTVTYHPEGDCPSCGAEWNVYHEAMMITVEDDRHGHECGPRCCPEVGQILLLQQQQLQQKQQAQLQQHLQ